MLEPQNLVVALFFGCWFALSIVRQFRSRSPKWLRRLDVFYLIANWRFFGPGSPEPEPFRHDYHLFYRDIFQTGEITRWIRVTPLSPKRLGAVIWNPEQRLLGWFISAAETLILWKRRGNSAAVERSATYLAILNQVESVAGFSQSYARQFAITASRDLVDPNDLRVIFCSEPHFLESVGGVSRR